MVDISTVNGIINQLITRGHHLASSKVGDLVVGFNPLKHMKVSWEYYSQYME